MTFAHPPQGEDEAAASYGQIRLVWMCNNARIEQGSRFVRVFIAEMRADQDGLLVTHLALANFDTFDLAKATSKNQGDITVPPRKIQQNALEFLM